MSALFGCLVVSVALAVAAADGRAQGEKVWFDDLPLTAPIEQCKGLALVTEAHRILSQRADPHTEEPPFPRDDRTPQILFLSVSHGISHALIVFGRGLGIDVALQDALSQILPHMPNNTAPLWIKLDIVIETAHVKSVAPGNRLDGERSLQGLVLSRDPPLALLPEELVAHTLVDSDQRLRPANIAAYLNTAPETGPVSMTLAERHELARRTESGRAFEIRRFRTASFFCDGSASFPLYRGHRLISDGNGEGEITVSRLRRAAEAGGTYLSRAVRSDGRFVYSFLPKTNRKSREYNILRHAGTTYAMLELYRQSPNEALLEAAERAIEGLLDTVRPAATPRPPGGKPALCVVERRMTKLGGAALAAVALAEYERATGKKRHRDTLDGLVRWIQSRQKANGEFAPHKATYPADRPLIFVSQYYPGEAILALMRAFALTGDESLLDAAEKGAAFLIDVRDRDVPLADLNHDHWLLYALNELHRARPKARFHDHASKIARAIMTRQNLTPRYPDWKGSYCQPPRSTPTATRTEGLCAAYELARDFGDPADKTKILGAIRNALAFQLQMQFQPESTLYLADPRRALGGFPRSLTDFEIRIDYVQHNISSLLCAARLIAAQAKR